MTFRLWRWFQPIFYHFQCPMRDTQAQNSIFNFHIIPAFATMIYCRQKPFSFQFFPLSHLFLSRSAVCSSPSASDSCKEKGGGGELATLWNIEHLWINWFGLIWFAWVLVGSVWFDLAGLVIVLTLETFDQKDVWTKRQKEKKKKRQKDKGNLDFSWNQVLPWLIWCILRTQLFKDINPTHNWY